MPEVERAWDDEVGLEVLRRAIAEVPRTTKTGEKALEAFDGADKESILRGQAGLWLSEPAIAALAEGAYCDKPAEAIRGSGYVVECLEAALWCFHPTDSFEAAVLAAAHLGDDADTTAAVCGQLAGAHYGIAGIPTR